MQIHKLAGRLRTAYRGTDVNRRADRFDRWMTRARGNDPASAEYDHAETVSEYYDLCSDFMVFGWGESLHFAPLSPSETLEQSIVRHQRLMIAKLEMREGMRVIDVGCGIGGPLRRVIREAGVSVLGVNASRVQLARARSLDSEAGLGHRVEYLECSFMNMDAIADDTFDRGYAIESTCHAPDKAGAFAEIYRSLKPGALFWCQEMCMTDRFDPADDRHRVIKEELMRGIALNGIASTGDVNLALESAGFEILEAKDRAVEGSGPITPWFVPMQARGGALDNALRRIPLGRKLMIGSTRLAEAVRVFPKGTAEVVALLDRTANAYVAGGSSGIFSPLYCVLARKPA